MTNQTATLATPKTSPATSAPAAAAASAPTTTRWTLEPTHSIVHFAVKHMIFATGRGRFRDVRATVVRHERDFAKSTIEAEIDAASVDTNLAARDEHLRSAEFFDVANHPKIRFTSTRIDALGGTRYRILGDLAIAGKTREVTLDATYQGELTDPWGNVRMGVVAEGTIDRRDWGLVWNGTMEGGGLLLAHEVKMILEVEFLKSA